MIDKLKKLVGFENKTNNKFYLKIMCNTESLTSHVIEAHAIKIIKDVYMFGNEKDELLACFPVNNTIIEKIESIN